VQALAMSGALLGAFASARVIRRFGGRALVVALSWALGFACIAMAAVGSPWAIGGIQAVVLLVIVPLNVVMETYETQIIPDALMGRVSNTITLTAQGLRWMSPLAVGFLVQATSPTRATLIWGGAFLVVAVLVQVNRAVHLLDVPIEEVAALSTAGQAS